MVSVFNIVSRTTSKKIQSLSKNPCHTNTTNKVITSTFLLVRILYDCFVFHDGGTKKETPRQTFGLRLEVELALAKHLKFGVPKAFLASASLRCFFLAGAPIPTNKRMVAYIGMF